MLIKRYASAQRFDGVIDRERLRSGSATSLERDAAGFLDLTYPSSDVPRWFADPALKDVDRPLEGRRFKTFNADETLPAPCPGLWMDRQLRLAVLAGRGHNRPLGPSASRSVYRHGGLTLMEMLTPWLVLEPAG
jgi:hypothetical protein